MMTEQVDTIVTALKASTILGTAVYRGWPPGFNSLPVAAVQDIRTAVGTGDGHALPMFLHRVTVHTWVRADDIRLADLHAEVITLVQAVAPQVAFLQQTDLYEAGGGVHTVTEFTALGPQ